MKTKPNTDQFKLTKDLSSFLEGGAADAVDRSAIPKEIVETPAYQPTINTKVHREQKVFRLPLDLINALKREAYERSVKMGARVTETEIVEEALRLLINR